jgi:SAM-dependent methyltransferase
MIDSKEYSYTRYLSSKKSLDDRSLNKDVWNNLSKLLYQLSQKNTLNILELGAGIGTMIERMLEHGLLNNAYYSAIDIDSNNVVEASSRLKNWAKSNGYEMDIFHDNLFKLKSNEKKITVNLEVIGLSEFMDRKENYRKWDLLLAHAFLDLIDLPSSISSILELIKPNGFFYFTLNFDGLTIFEPKINDKLEEQILTQYHKTMDERYIAGKLSGDSKTGRRLYYYLRNSAAEIIDIGSSDWIVFPKKEGYFADEAYFLHYTINTIYEALRNNTFDENDLVKWIERRHMQIDQKQLIYIAHQLDYLGKNSTTKL